MRVLLYSDGCVAEGDSPAMALSAYGRLSARGESRWAGSEPGRVLARLSGEGRRFLTEDAAAFCARVRPELVGLLHVQCGDRAVAEEAAQEALARACERWDRVRLMNNPGGWVYRVGLNLVTSRFRRRAVERRVRARLGSERPPVDDAPDADDVIAVRIAVAELPERQRMVVALRFYLGMSVAESAEIMDCAEGTVKSLTNRAVHTLRERSGLVTEEVPDGV